MPEAPGSFMAHISQVPPANLYHYTSLDVLLKILNSGILWASNLRYLNDSSEYAHLLVVVDRRVQELLVKADGQRAAHLALLSRILRKNMDRDVFAACFSTKKDDLNQWRGYCPPGLGVCIGFPSVALRATTHFAAATEWVKDALQLNEDALLSQLGPVPVLNEDAPLSQLGPVAYLADDSRFDAVIEKACEPPTQEFNSSPAFVGLLTASIAQFYKHDSFREEQEWRIHVGATPRTGKVEGVQFRIGKSTLVPYVEIQLRSRQPAFISEIIVGPSPNISLSVEAVRALLAEHKMYDVPVTPSAVPYRHW
jgi:Protein of unknown function (DUF2971)